MGQQNMFIQWILFSYMKEWHTDTCYTTDETWKHYVKWINQTQKAIYESVHMSVHHRKIYRDRIVDSGCLGLE